MATPKVIFLKRIYTTPYTLAERIAGYAHDRVEPYYTYCHVGITFDDEHLISLTWDGVTVDKLSDVACDYYITSVDVPSVDAEIALKGIQVDYMKSVRIRKRDILQAILMPRSTANLTSCSQWMARMLGIWLDCHPVTPDRLHTLLTARKVTN